MYSLVAVFRARGWRWPLRDGDALEIFGPESQLVGTISAALLTELLAAYLGRAALDARVVAELTAPPEEPRPASPKAPRLPSPGHPVPPRKPLAGMNGHRLRGYRRGDEEARP